MTPQGDGMKMWQIGRISLYLALLSCYFVKQVECVSYEHCESYDNDEDGRPLVLAKHPLSSLAPNTFHQICPSRSSSTTLSYPICGDGTTFSFFVTRPPRANLASGHQSKILIEFQGGGACWDAETCQQAKERLTFPISLNKFSGYSCSETAVGVERGEDGYPINMLCAQSIGDVDLTSYHTIVVPYCTQDIHIGDSYQSYSDNGRNLEEENGNGNGVYHHGAHNLMSVMRYIYKNFKNPSHIMLTGCSAGATVLPLAYDLLNKHYNHILGKSLLPTVASVNINVLSDSPVYLTPQYFLNNAFDNWKPETLVKKTHFKYNKWRYNTDYGTILWDYVLKRGPNIDQWGLITHTNDPVSLQYFEAMGGNYFWDERHRNLNENNDDQQTWWSELSSDLDLITAKHKNVDSFLIEGEGHCSFGLYYALQEDGFQDWASGIIKEKKLIGHTSFSVPIFILSALLGCALSWCTISSSRKNTISGDLDESMLGDGKKKLMQISQQNKAYFERFKTWPITAGYILTVTVYFWTMLMIGRFTHPLDNPSLGPNALTLSDFGINNPTLIVYNFEIVRLFVSAFLCSGILPYLIVISSAFFYAKSIEQSFQNPKNFGTLCIIIIFGCNLFYGCVAKGASCSSIPLVLGLNVFAIASQQNKSDVDDLIESQNKMNGVDDEQVTSVTSLPRPLCFTIFFALATSLIFPFNSWIMIVMATIISSLSANYLFSSQQASDDVMTYNDTKDLTRKPLLVVAVIYGILFLVLMLNRGRDIEIYKYPYLTGCEMIYSDEVSQFVEEFEDEQVCAQFCVPHLVSVPFSWGAKKYVSGASLQRGLCYQNGFEEHVADTTFTRLGYSLDVSLYQQGEQEER